MFCRRGVHTEATVYMYNRSVSTDSMLIIIIYVWCRTAGLPSDDEIQVKVLGVLAYVH